MYGRSLLAASATLLLAGAVARPQEAVLPPADPEPMLRLEAGGPTTIVNSLALSPDGKTLYAAGYDKVVRVWTLGKDGKFALDSASYRVPVGAGLDGAINAIALSSDGKWLAVGGLGVVRGGPGGRGPGLVVDKVSAMTEPMWRDQGLVYVFNTTDPTDVRLLRGHLGPVLSLAFAPAPPGKAPLLVSAAREWDEDYSGALCVWDIGRKWDPTGKPPQYLASRYGYPDPLKITEKSALFRPGLAAWPTGDKPEQLRVAFGCGDGKLRVWDVAAGEVVGAADGGSFNDPLVPLPDQGRVVSASAVAEGALVQVWDASAGPAVKRRFRIPKPYGGVSFLPRHVTPFSSRPGGKVDSVAVLLRVHAPDKDTAEHDGECWLQVLDLRAGGRPALPAVRLWDHTTLPVAAAVPGGEYLAVAGSAEADIRVYAIKDLLEDLTAGRAAHLHQPPLRSAGAIPRSVAFVAKGKGEGLWLSEDPGKGPGARRKSVKGGMVFDFARGGLTDDLAGWEVAAPDLGDWEVEARKDEKELRIAGLVVSQGKKPAHTFLFPANEEVDDYALLPGQPGRPALLAVALRQAGEPRLVLYNVATGDLFRHYVWHTGRIRALAFSRDGRFLASAAEDQMVCVWSLTVLCAISSHSNAENRRENEGSEQ